MSFFVIVVVVCLVGFFVDVFIRVDVNLVAVAVAVVYFILIFVYSLAFLVDVDVLWCLTKLFNIVLLSNIRSK